MLRKKLKVKAYLMKTFFFMVKQMQCVMFAMLRLPRNNKSENTQLILNNNKLGLREEMTTFLTIKNILSNSEVPLEKTKTGKFFSTKQSYHPNYIIGI